MNGKCEGFFHDHCYSESIVEYKLYVREFCTLRFLVVIAVEYYQSIL